MSAFAECNKTKVLLGRHHRTFLLESVHHKETKTIIYYMHVKLHAWQIHYDNYVHWVRPVLFLDPPSPRLSPIVPVAHPAAWLSL